ncbi:MAG: hypothetical protein N4J56_006232 [Chroococcidiopsis sp. SAG 2025]|nr:hypothetical protein [Chroococcidiopsis sp. SAG 2025]
MYHVRESGSGSKLYSGEISIQCNPKVRKAQRVTLILYNGIYLHLLIEIGKGHALTLCPLRIDETQQLALRFTNVFTISRSVIHTFL